MCCRSVVFTLSGISGVTGERYDLVDNIGNYVFYNLLGTDIIGVTFSVDCLATSFRLTSYRQTALWGSNCQTKYLFSKNGADTDSSSSTISAYDPSYTDAGDIQSNQGVGSPGILETDITYVSDNTYLKETIYIDITNFTTFISDINTWLYMNNFNDIQYDSGLDKIIINDINNKTYIHIKYKV